MQQIPSLNSLFSLHHDSIEAWFQAQWQKTPPLFYGSVDLRNAGFKLAPVDTNLYPAGFNNLNDLAPCIAATKKYFQDFYPNQTDILLIPESHTRNSFYFDNLRQLISILEGAGLKLHLGTLNTEATPEPNLNFESLIREGNKVGVKGFFPDLILLNNDLSSGVPELLQNLDQIILPPLCLGWHKRLKSSHFKYYAEICHSFALLLNIDPWFIMPLFDHCNEVDFLKKKGEGCLAFRAEKLLFQIKQKYAEYGIQEEPFLIVKADAGTYGMGVMTIKDPQELLHLNRKQRTKMSASKGGNEVHQAIIQEGIYSTEKWNDNATAEAVIYGIGAAAVGGFYRVHEGKDPTESLNAPGMEFHPLKSNSDELFYNYSVIARLAFLAATHERGAE